MRRSRPSGLAVVVACSLLITLGGASTAMAARVTVLGHDGRARVENDRFLAVAVTPATAQAEPSLARAAAAGRRKRKTKAKPQLTVVVRLGQLASQQAITVAQETAYLSQFRSALREVKRLHGTRAAELEAVVENLHGIAASGQMTVSRLPAIFLTLARNMQWWKTGPLLSADARVEFAGSQLVWEYYPGQGIELQELASFGKADGLYTAGAADYPQMEALLSELIALASDRAGGLAWEYYFHFDGGSPPWVSAMAQGTALEALTRAYAATGDPMFLATAHRALPVLTAAPPAGVSVQTGLGRRFLQYSFAPGTDIINAFLQTLIGIDDYAAASDDHAAQLLFAAGNVEAEAELPAFNTGAWSLYQPGVEDDLSYHELVTGFLQQLCTRTAAPVYCSTATAFQDDLTTAPVLTQLTTSTKAGAASELHFTLSKVSHVGVIIVRGTSTVLATSASFPHGVDSFTLPSLRRGTYTVRLAATDLAGNFSRILGSLSVKAAPHTT